MLREDPTTSLEDRSLHRVRTSEFYELRDWSEQHGGKGMHDYCALAGAINVPNAAECVRDMLWVQQHRGEDGVGIYSFNGKPHFVKKSGRVGRVFPEEFDFSALPGNDAIGHSRYSTLGEDGLQADLQPFYMSTKFKDIALGHNGQLHDAEQMREKLVDRGAGFQSSSDSEIILHKLAQSREKTLEDALAKELGSIPFAYSLLLYHEDSMYAIRDPAGIRPLSLARYEGGFLAASEDGAFRIFNAEKIRDVEPGEIVRINSEGITSQKMAEAKARFCSFECVYFSGPRSTFKGRMHEDFRKATGKEIYAQEEEYFDRLLRTYGHDLVIVPILDSGKQGSEGLAEASGIELKHYFLRRHNAPRVSGRSYTASTQDARVQKAFRKLDLREEKIRGKVIITGDDSMVRGTTMRVNNERLRDAGAEKIVNVMFSPTITGVCNMGVNHQSVDELVASGNSLEDIAGEVCADKVIFLDLKRHKKLIREVYGESMCTGCFGGSYPKVEI